MIARPENQCRNLVLLGHAFLTNGKMFISCLLEDMDRSEQLKNSLDGSLCFPGANRSHIDTFSRCLAFFEWQTNGKSAIEI